MQVIILYAAVVLIWGSTWAVIPYQLGVVAEEMSVAYRFALASLALFVYALVTGRRIRIPRAYYPMVIVTGSLMFSMNYMFTYFAINYVTSGLFAVAFSMLVVANAFFERLFFRTRLEKRLMLGSMFGVAGITCLFWGEVGSFSLEDESLYGILLALIAVVLASLGNMGAMVNNARNLPVVAVNAHGMAWGALISLGVAVFRGQEFKFLLQTDYVVSLLYLSIIGSSLVFGCYVALLRQIGSARAAYTSVLFPVVALLISTVVENYQWSTLAVTGIVLIVFGNWLALTRNERKE
jgi:drug/metabolite transporter (DMT)-like permease